MSELRILIEMSRLLAQYFDVIKLGMDATSDEYSVFEDASDALLDVADEMARWGR